MTFKKYGKANPPKCFLKNLLKSVEKYSQKCENRKLKVEKLTIERSYH